MLRRTCRAISFRDAGSVRSFPSGVLKVSNGDGSFGGVSCASRTTASGVCRPRTSSKATRSWAARISPCIRRMASSLEALASRSALDIASPLSVRWVHHLRKLRNSQGIRVTGDAPSAGCASGWKPAAGASEDCTGLQTKLSAQGFGGSRPPICRVIESYRRLWGFSYSRL